jgi:hypothetical protein
MFHMRMKLSVPEIIKFELLNCSADKKVAASENLTCPVLVFQTLIVVELKEAARRLQLNKNVMFPAEFEFPLKAD